MINIDMWYGDDLHDATSLDVLFSDTDCVYRGNIYRGAECIGDYETNTVQELEKKFPQLKFQEA